MGNSREQVNVRLDQHHVRVLETIAYLQSRSVTDVVRGLVVDLVADQETLADVRQAMEARARYEGRADGTIEDFEQRSS